MDQTTRKKPARNSAVTDMGAIVSHTTRRRIWGALYGRTMSPKELADELGYSTGHVSYHVSELCRLSVVELVDERPVRGAVEHFYRLTERWHLDEDQVASLTPEQSAANLLHIFQEEFADASAALESRKIVERTEHTVQRHPLNLDEEGWLTMFQMCEEFCARVDGVLAEAAERTRDNPDARSIHGILHVNYFEMPDREDRVKQF